METENTTSRTKFKFNWGTGIALSFVFFCSFIIYIVVRAFQLDVDLVSETYYLDELAYQDRIEEKANLQRSGEEVVLHQTSQEVIIKFPEQFKEAEGDIHFYHPSRKIFDKHYSISLGAANQQRIKKEELVKGNYKVKMNWQVSNVSYFQEKRIFIR